MRSRLPVFRLSPGLPARPRTSFGKGWATMLVLILMLSLPALACALPGSAEPTATPTAPPPTAPPTEVPPTATTEPTAVPTEAPTEAPTATVAPTEEPEATATRAATPASPISRPTAAPTAENRVVVGDTLDPTLDPGFGEVSLSTGFGPDPFAVALISGGEVEVGGLDLASGCFGYAAVSPDFRLIWDGETEFLRIFFEAEQFGQDTTLIVSDPEGEWHCNDDFESLNPLVQIDDPPAGQYDIWVGSFAPGDFINGVLYVSELELGPGEGAGPGELDFNLDPNFGSADLSPGFGPDPWPVAVTAGGPVAVGALGLASGCAGYTSSAPDYRINWEGSTDSLRIFFISDEGGDPTLVALSPSGEWFCNDDFESLNPLIEIADPADGPYDIWVGSYTPNDTLAGTLYVSELDFGPGNMPGDSEDLGFLDPSLEPNFGSDELSAGFPDDPFSIEVLSGGSVDVATQDLGDDCTGYATSAPDFRLNWSGTTDFFRIFFVPIGGADATLIVNDPDGNWHCNDDFESLNPLVEIADPVAGQYDIWVGSFSPDDFVIGSLYITEVAIGPGDVSAAIDKPVAV